MIMTITIMTTTITTMIMTIPTAMAASTVIATDPDHARHEKRRALRGVFVLADQRPARMPATEFNVAFAFCASTIAQP
jgi:hypothetical protein